MSTSNRPVPLSSDDEITFKGCMTDVFRWVRAGAKAVEEIPEALQRLADDVQQAWHDSAQ